MLCLLKAILAWLIMWFVGITLLGLVVRGVFWSSPPVDGATDRVRELLTWESRRMHAANFAITLLSIVLTAAYFFALYHFWNIALAATAGLLMVARVPELVSEIAAEKKIARFADFVSEMAAEKKVPRVIISTACSFFFGTVLMLLGLPLTWYSLCKWPS